MTGRERVHAARHFKSPDKAPLQYYYWPVGYYEHGEKLNDLKNIIIKYLPEEYSSPLRFEILKDIYDIEKDLQKHSLIENRLLVSLVQKIEKSYE